jgi:hypothetical protein
MTAVTAIRPAPLYEFFTTKTQGSMTAVARLHANCRFVDEFHFSILTAQIKNPAIAGISKKNL